MQTCYFFNDLLVFLIVVDVNLRERGHVLSGPFLAPPSRRYILHTCAASAEQCASSDMTITADRLSQSVGGQQSTPVVAEFGRALAAGRLSPWLIND